MASSKSVPFVPYRNNAVTNTKILVRSGPCSLWGWTINNPNASEAFIQVFNAADIADVTLGTTVCDDPLKIPASGAVIEDSSDFPVSYYNKGMVIAATTTESGSTAPASALSVVLKYT